MANYCNELVSLFIGGSKSSKKAGILIKVLYLVYHPFASMKAWIRSSMLITQWNIVEGRVQLYAHTK